MNVIVWKGDCMSIYNFNVKKSNGQEISMEQYQGKVLLIVNTASKCGLTPQFEELQKIYEEVGNENFEIIGFPCNQFANQDPGNMEEILNVCSINYGVTFTMMEKIDVNGKNEHPLYKYLKSNTSGLFNDSIKWNFTKFLVDSEGNVVTRYAPTTNPKKIKPKIEELVKNIKLLRS